MINKLKIFKNQLHKSKNLTGKDYAITFSSFAAKLKLHLINCIHVIPILVASAPANNLNFLGFCAFL